MSIDKDFAPVDWKKFVHFYQNADSVEEHPPYNYLEGDSPLNERIRPATLMDILEECRLAINFNGSCDYDAGEAISGEINYLEKRISKDQFLALFRIAGVFHPDFMYDVRLQDIRVTKSKLLAVHDCKVRDEDDGSVNAMLSPETVQFILETLDSLDIEGLKLAAGDSEDDVLFSQLEHFRVFLASIAAQSGGLIVWTCI